MKCIRKKYKIKVYKQLHDPGWFLLVDERSKRSYFTKEVDNIAGVINKYWHAPSTLMKIFDLKGSRSLIYLYSCEVYLYKRINRRTDK